MQRLNSENSNLKNVMMVMHGSMLSTSTSVMCVHIMKESKNCIAQISLLLTRMSQFVFIPLTISTFVPNNYKNGEDEEGEEEEDKEEDGEEHEEMMEMKMRNKTKKNNVK